MMLQRGNQSIGVLRRATATTSRGEGPRKYVMVGLLPKTTCIWGVTTVSNAWLACQNNLHLGSHKIGNGGGCHVMTPMSQYDAAKG